MHNDNEESSSTSEDPNYAALDPEGDVVLRCLDQSSYTKMDFRASSKVLQLASPVFSRMFRPSFCEGQRLLLENCPVIDLEDDDAHLMGLILKILHYQGDPTDYVVDPQKMARLSIHSDKYDCTRALRPWISTWFRNVEKADNSAKELGFLVLAAYLFNDSAEFKKISRTALLQLAPLFSVDWDEVEIFSILPIHLIESLTKRIQRILDELESELQSTEYSLRGFSRMYDTGQLICTSCSRTLPGEAKKCHPCRNTELSIKYCTSETRIAEYFAVLRKAELWPTVGPFTTCSVSDISLKFTCARKDTKHFCTIGAHCPLIYSLDSLCRKVDEAQKKVCGLCLDCIRSENDVEGAKECEHK